MQRSSASGDGPSLAWVKPVEVDGYARYRMYEGKKCHGVSQSANRDDAIAELHDVIRLNGARASSAGAAAGTTPAPAPAEWRRDNPTHASLVGRDAVSGEGKMTARRMLPNRRAVVAAQEKRAKSRARGISCKTNNGYKTVHDASGRDANAGGSGGSSSTDGHTRPEPAKGSSADEPVDEAADGPETPLENPTGERSDKLGASPFDDSGADGRVASLMSPQSPGLEPIFSDVGVEFNFDDVDSSFFDDDELGGLFDLFEPGEDIGSAA